MQTEQKLNIIHIHKAADLYRLDPSKRYLLALYQSALKELTESDLLTVYNLTANRDKNILSKAL